MLSSVAADEVLVEVDMDICMRLRLQAIEGRDASLLAANPVPIISPVEYLSRVDVG
jgi:hypothetical protein